MTPFRVDWTDAALDMLADIWTQASDRAAVNDAQDYIDAVLARDPLRHGRHRSEGLYQIIVLPLTALYSIDQAKKIVQVEAVWYTP
jgi:plasmid stabilization system protein ParE